MELYTNFIGVDIGKFTFVAAVYGDKASKEYDNTVSGIKIFLKDHKKLLPKSLCILETTGGYETRLLYTLCDKGYGVHRADTRKVKNFIRSLGNQAKTDILDAKALALYGYERHERLTKFETVSKRNLELYELVQRRQDLKHMLVAEKNQYQAPKADMIKSSCQTVIDLLTKEVTAISKTIDKLIESDEVLRLKKSILMSLIALRG